MDLPDYIAKYEGLEAGQTLPEVTVSLAGGWGQVVGHLGTPA